MTQNLSMATGSRKPITVSWERTLANEGASAITSSSWSVSGGDITLESGDSFTDKSTLCWVSGGSQDTQSILVNEIMTDTGETLIERVRVFCEAGSNQ
jgi:hypothetical protein